MRVGVTYGFDESFLKKRGWISWKIKSNQKSNEIILIRFVRASTSTVCDD